MAATRVNGWDIDHEAGDAVLRLVAVTVVVVIVVGVVIVVVEVVVDFDP
jgi:hypothetical protein